MKRALGVGIIGCGNISGAYLALAPMFRGIEIRACADLVDEAARASARQFGIRAQSVDALLSADDIDIVLNLTVPAAHYEISALAVEAGKHVYSEKPFVLSLRDGSALAGAARRRGVRVGSAPDTFLGGSHQLARRLVDAGAVGRITSGTCFVMGHGMEHWHPDPDFFFKPGAGPVLDIGPYYVTNLIQLLGPVKRVAALSATPSAERVITSRPRRGERIAVETPTTIQSLLEFDNGATVMFAASWDVWQHGHEHMELYGETGTLHLPDPNYFGGTLTMTRRRDKVKRLPAWDHPFGVANEFGQSGGLANYRGAGLCDMALAIAADRPHRCSLELALHAVDVMTSILESGETGRFVALSTTCARPEPLRVGQARAMLGKAKG